MVPKDFDWRKYSKEHNFTEERYQELRSICATYRHLKLEYEDVITLSAYSLGGVIKTKGNRAVYNDTMYRGMRAAEISDKLDLLEKIFGIADARMAPYMKEYLTDANYIHCGPAEFLDDKSYALDRRYFTRCWRYTICCLDEELRKRENHSTK